MMFLNKLFYVLFEAIDDEGPFFQNIYPYAKSESNAIELVMTYLNAYNYSNITIDEIAEIDNVNNIEDLIQIEEFKGYIQNVKHGYIENMD